MAQHALGLGLIGGYNREVVALQRCKRCIWPSMHWDLD